MPRVRIHEPLPFTLSLLGIALSAVSQVEHYRAHTVADASSWCRVGERLDCTAVSLSQQSIALGVPVPSWGIVGFVALALAAALGSSWLRVLSTAAALVSVALGVIQVARIGAVCLLCEAVHLLTLILLVVVWRIPKERLSGYRSGRALGVVFVPPLVLLLGATLVPAYWGAFGWEQDVPFAQGTTAEGYPWLGAEEPRLVVHEFTDYACPHCKVATARMLNHVADHPDALRLVRRQYPRMRCHLGMSTHCQPARVAYCAGKQGKFWQADRWLFEHGTGKHEVSVPELARALHLNAEQLTACVTSDEAFQRVQEEARFARQHRLMGTPYYWIEGSFLMLQDAEARIDGL